MTLYEGLVPLDHYCGTCGKNKEEVNFTVVTNTHCRTVASHCNSCIKLGLCRAVNNARKRRRVISLSTSDDYKHEVRKRIRENIANYFKEVSNAG